MYTQCHICNESIKPNDIRDVKCKLCCDGLEQEYCQVCAYIYNGYKLQVKSGDVMKVAKYYIKELQHRRQVAVNRTRFKLIQGGK